MQRSEDKSPERFLQELTGSNLQTILATKTNQRIEKHTSLSSDENSKTVTLCPALWRLTAVARPARPAPMTAILHEGLIFCSALVGLV